eukprot:Sspe_Gene.25026::Locus_10007_Transcript_2_2_Confidence_0.667_Length_1443::g.25026::m.25026/K11090/LA, SSB; lupus La protein
MAITDEQKSQLVRQFRFYFSNSNIMKDKFLLGKVKENPEGWVQLAVLCTFNRVKAITTDVAEVASALEGIEGLELNADKTSIRRKEPLPEKWTPDERTLYAKGVPEDEDIEVLEKFFSQYGKVLMVQKRRAPRAGDVKYKNSVHIEFETVEDMQKALAAKPVYKDVPLEVMTKEAHDAERGPKKGKPAKRERDEDEKEEGEAKKAKEEEEKEEPIVLPRGASILFTEVGTSDWKVIKGALKDTADVRFCVVQDDTAKVMFHSEGRC